jgi:hypothetical protein
MYDVFTLARNSGFSARAAKAPGFYDKVLR